MARGRSGSAPADPSSLAPLGSLTLGPPPSSFASFAPSPPDLAVPALRPPAAADAFGRLLGDLASTSSDPRSARRAACCAALVEACRERRPSGGAGGHGDEDGASPSEVFVASLAALTSLAERHESARASGDADDDGTALAEAALPLLEVLRRVLPHAAGGGNNSGAIVARAHGPAVRTLRMLAALARTMPGGDPSGKQGGRGEAGPGALLRAVLSASSSLVLSAPDGAGGDAAGSALRASVLPLVHDARPKVRRAAAAACLEVVSAPSAQIDCYGEDGDVDPERYARLGRRRRDAADVVWEHCHGVLSGGAAGGRSGGKDGTDGGRRLVHVLRLLSAALPRADDVRIRVKFGEACVSLMSAENVPADAAGECLACLLSCVDDSESGSGTTGGQGGEELSRFAARALAFLLQNRPPAGGGGAGGADRAGTAHARCVAACVGRMMAPTAGGEDPAKPPPAAVLAAKLLPDSLRSVLRLCGDGAGDEDGGPASEFNRLASLSAPRLASWLVSGGDGRRVALEALPRCVSAAEECLSVRHRGDWATVLPGGYARLASELAGSLLSMRESPGGSRDADAEGRVESSLRTLVSSLVRLRGDVRGDGPARSAVEYAASAAADGTGVDLFLSLVDLSGDGGDGADEGGGGGITAPAPAPGGVRDDLAWLLPVLRRSTPAGPLRRRARLSSFHGRVLPLARRCDAASASPGRTAAESSVQRSRVLDLWSLFPSYCAEPVDVRDGLEPAARVVVKAMGDHGRYPGLVPIICGGLRTLAAGIAERRELAPSDASEGDYEALSAVTTKVLPSLFKLVESLNDRSAPSASKAPDSAMEVEEPSGKDGKGDKGAGGQQGAQLVEAVTECIGELARVCPPDFLRGLFRKVVQRLLRATADASAADGGRDAAASVRMCSLLGLGQALVSSGTLDGESVSLLYRSVRSLVRTDEHCPRVQKRAYRCLAALCDRHPDFIASGGRIDEMADLMAGTAATSQVSARHVRLRCMTAVVSGLDCDAEPGHAGVIPRIMGEVLLCLKDSNAKTREAAYQLLLAMADARGDMTEYVKVVLAALGAQTTHMRSAAVMALSRLAFERARDDDGEVRSLLPDVMRTVAVLFDDPSREVTKSVIGFVRVSVAAMSREQQEPLLPLIVGGIMRYGKGRDRFRSKIKIILKRLVRVHGFDAVAPLVPETDARLINHMRKLSERAARRRAAAGSSAASAAGGGAGTVFDDMMESDEDDSDGGRTLMTGATGFTRMTSGTGRVTARSAAGRSVAASAKTAKSARTAASRRGAGGGARIKAELEGEVLDLLDSSRMVRSVRFAEDGRGGGDDDPFFGMDDDSDDDGGADDVRFDGQGRIVISDGPAGAGGGTAPPDERYDSDDDENLELKAGGGGKRRRVSKFESVKLAKAERDRSRAKPSRDKQSGALGAAYKSRKAGGDVRKKGQKYEPYAYVPLNAKDYTKKNRGKAVSKMGSVVRSKRKRS